MIGLHRVFGTVGLAGLLLVAVGCGSSSSAPAAGSTHSKMHHHMKSHQMMKGGHLHLMTPEHATLGVKTSKYGKAIFASNGRVLYVFGPDKGGTTSHCYGVCAQAWPPVLTSGAPRVSAGGLQASLLGVTMRRDGTHQVTYHGQPLYYYSGDRVGSVLCQHVVLHGGLWLILEPGGRPNMMMGAGM